MVMTHEFYRQKVYRSIFKEETSISKPRLSDPSRLLRLKSWHSAPTSPLRTFPLPSGRRAREIGRPSTDAESHVPELGSGADREVRDLSPYIRLQRCALDWRRRRTKTDEGGFSVGPPPPLLLLLKRGAGDMPKETTGARQFRKGTKSCVECLPLSLISDLMPRLRAVTRDTLTMQLRQTAKTEMRRPDALRKLPLAWTQLCAADGDGEGVGGCV